MFGIATPAADIAASPPTPGAIAASTTAILDDDEGFGGDAEPGSPLSALAHAMSAPSPAAASTPASSTAASASFALPSPASPYATLRTEAATTIPDGNTASLGDDDFVRPPNALQSLIATIKGSRRNTAIAAGAAGLFVLVMALAFCGDSSTQPKQVAASETAKTTTRKAAAPEPKITAPVDAMPVEPAPPTPTEPSVASGPTAEELAAAAAAEPTPPTDPVPPEAGASAAHPKRDTGKASATPNNTAATKPTGTNTTGSGAKKLGGKQVVLEYDTQARESKAVASAPTSDQAAIQKARGAYASGNQRLFAGDASGAIKFYRQSLGFYPGYVAGYRGLGLAYAQQGDKPKALQALRMYVSSVPTAKDAPLIRKRISSLQGK